MQNFQKNHIFSESGKLFDVKLRYRAEIFLIPFVFLIMLSGGIHSYANEIKVIPSGEAVGVKIYTNGLLVIGTGEVEDKSGKSSSPSNECGLKTNDIITNANNTEIRTIEQFSEIVQKNPGGINLKVTRADKSFCTTAVPVITADGSAKLGLWVRDSTAGIGTVTYVNPADGSFAALGHGICDVDTGNILSVKSGNILDCSFLSVIKSQKGIPGELSGTFENTEMGIITKNTPCGIFGKITSDAFYTGSDAVPAASASQVETGNAYILADIDGSGVKQYSIEIKKLSQKSDTKGIIFEVTDKTLLEKAGGIVQGMSGAPILQNGKLAGAVTHVFVNEPAKGYGIFIENMLAETEEN